MNLNQKIIHARETVLVRENGKNEVLTKFIYLVVFIPILSIPFVIDRYFENLDTLLLIALFGLLFFATEAVNLSIFSPITHKESLYYYMHYLLKGRAERNQEVKAFLDNYVPDVTESNRFTENVLFKDLNRDTLTDWMKTNVSDVKSVLKLCYERSVNEDKSLNLAFIYWTQLIPKVENIDTTKLLLMTCKLGNASDVNSIWSGPSDFISKEEVTSVFRDYTDSDLIRFFTSPLCFTLYYKVIQFYSSRKMALPVKKNLYGLYLDYELLMAASSTKFIKGNLNIGLYGDFRIEQILDSYTLTKAGAAMTNCIASRKDKCMIGSSFVYLIYLKEKPFIIFELNKAGKVVEVKRKANKILDLEENLVFNKLLSEAKKR